MNEYGVIMKDKQTKPNNKYELTDKTFTVRGITLHRIRALQDFDFYVMSYDPWSILAVKRLIVVKKGELGGWIESEDNLSTEDKSWVADNAKVYGEAYVGGSSYVSGNAIVNSKANVCGNSWVRDQALVSGGLINLSVIKDKARVSDSAYILYSVVKDKAIVRDSGSLSTNVIVEGEAIIMGRAHLSCDEINDRYSNICKSKIDCDQNDRLSDRPIDNYTKVRNHAIIGGDAKISGPAIIEDTAQVYEEAYVRGNVVIKDDARVHGSSHVIGNVVVGGNAHVYERAQVLDYSIIEDQARVYGESVLINVKIKDNANVCGCVEINNPFVIYSQTSDTHQLIHQVIGKDGYIDNDHKVISVSGYKRDLLNLTGYLTKDNKIMIVDSDGEINTISYTRELYRNIDNIMRKLPSYDIINESGKFNTPNQINNCLDFIEKYLTNS